MKKTLLLTIALMGIGMAAQAKQLTFYYNNSAVDNGGTVEYAGYEIYPGYVPNEWEYFLNPEILIESDIDASVTIHVVSDHDIQLCIGGGCEQGDDITKIVNLPAGEKSDLLLDTSIMLTEDQGATLPAIEATIEAYYTDSPADKTTIYLKMGNTAGIDGMGAEMNGIRACCNGINYSLTSNTMITVSDLNGRTVVSRNVSGDGRIDLNQLPAGVYVYNANGAMKASGKIFIK